MDEIKLKPCPFCGGEPYMAQNYLEQKYVRCPECGACVWGKGTDKWRIAMMGEKKQKKPPDFGWISVEDALPDALQNVLVCTDINTVTISWINGDGWTFADTGNGHTEDWPFEAVKYWMPLPEPPEEE